MPLPKLEKLDLNSYSIIIFEWEIMSSNLAFTRGLKMGNPETLIPGPRTTYGEAWPAACAFGKKS